MFSPVEDRAGKLSLQPEALGADQEATNGLKHSEKKLRISQAVYRPLFELVWGVDFDINWPSNVEQICSTPGGNFPTATPITLSSVDRTKANNIYDHWGQSISFLEHTPDVSPFTSKYDASLVGNYTMTADEMAGYKLFNG